MKRDSSATPSGRAIHHETDRCGFDRNASHSNDCYVCTCGYIDQETPNPSPSASRSERQSTHWEGCWRDPKHHACAVAQIERLSAARSTSGDSENLAAMTKATYSHVDGRDLLHQLQPNGAHHIDIIVRINGEDRRYEGDWLKTLTWARDGHNMGEYADNPKLRAHIEAARAACDSNAGTASGAVSASGTRST